MTCLILQNETKLKEKRKKIELLYYLVCVSIHHAQQLCFSVQKYRNKQMGNKIFAASLKYVLLLH